MGATPNPENLVRGALRLAYQRVATLLDSIHPDDIAGAEHALADADMARITRDTTAAGLQQIIDHLADSTVTTYAIEDEIDSTIGDLEILLDMIPPAVKDDTTPLTRRRIITLTRPCYRLNDPTRTHHGHRLRQLIKIARELPAENRDTATPAGRMLSVLARLGGYYPRTTLLGPTASDTAWALATLDDTALHIACGLATDWNGTCTELADAATLCADDIRTP